MQDLFKTMLTPQWLISVVVIGVLLNILSSYLKSGIDRGASSVMGRFARSRSRYWKARRDMIIRLAHDPEYNRSTRVRCEIDGFMSVVLLGGGFVALILAASGLSMTYVPGKVPPLNGRLPIFILFVIGYCSYMVAAGFLGRRMLYRSALIWSEKHVGVTQETPQVVETTSATESTTP
ncbi:hypothetical protein [Paraburkholderia gardini]|uniref:Uncharacterized protein n=1 Tax=Paraburkholderia gardini TaxID=2823469 RepID=A0ABM8U9R6_9BURK|nr:hypothetical protein [Paraburkholderia gardini]CAG4920255.1 hypothetical protein R54767_04692 [Paraburkholderia gardini]